MMRIIVNPQLKFRAGIDSAPTLVAEGRGLVADKIVALAQV